VLWLRLLHTCSTSPSQLPRVVCAVNRISLPAPPSPCGLDFLSTTTRTFFQALYLIQRGKTCHLVSRWRTGRLSCSPVVSRSRIPDQKNKYQYSTPASEEQYMWMRREPGVVERPDDFTIKRKLCLVTNLIAASEGSAVPEIEGLC
jgi:hypothetical protein